MASPNRKKLKRRKKSDMILYELQITNYELQILNFELSITNTLTLKLK